MASDLAKRLQSVETARAVHDGKLFLYFIQLKMPQTMPRYRLSPWHIVSLSDGSGARVIERLPDSLLLYIFELDHGNSSLPQSRYGDERSTIRSTLRVCKRWHRLASRVLYSSIELDLRNKAPALWTRRRLFSRLQGDSSLRCLTRNFTIMFANEYIPRDGIHEVHACDGKVDDVIQLLRWWLPSLKKVEVSGNLVEAGATRIMWQLCKMPLKEIRFSSPWHPISLSFFLKYFQYPNLKLLRWDNIGWDSDPDRLVAHRRELSLTEYSQSSKMLEERLYSSDLQSLSLFNPEVTVGALKLLFMYCRSLQSFELRYGCGSGCEFYTVKDLQELLDLQAVSLRKIALGHFVQRKTDSSGSPCARQMLDFRNMLSLEKLTLNADNVFGIESAHFAGMVFTPRPTNLDIEYNSEDQHSISSSELDRNTYEWLVSFSTAWSRQAQGSRPDLQLHLSGDLEEPYGEFFSFDPQVGHDAWPWDRLETAKPEMGVQGVKLTWTPPTYSKDEWHEVVLEHWKDRQLQLHERCYSEDVKDELDVVGQEDKIVLEKHDHDPYQQRLCRAPFLSGTRRLCVH